MCRRELTVGSLFAGIGGFDLGLERAGCRTLWQVELEPFRRAILARWFPDAVRHADVRGVGAHNLAAVDIICGGFPCQDISQAGRGAGIAGARSGLWFQFARIIGELRPRYVLVENVPAIRRRGLGVVLGDLAALGYDAEWNCIPAVAVGAPHRRDRFWLVAYPAGGGCIYCGRPVADGYDEHEECWQRSVADTEGESKRPGLCADESAALGWRRLGDTGGAVGSWAAEPDVGRVAYGIPARVDRLAALGDSLVPQIAEWIGRRIVSLEQ